jgi:hypothetical protein
MGKPRQVKPDDPAVIFGKIKTAEITSADAVNVSWQT